MCNTRDSTAKGRKEKKKGTGANYGGMSCGMLGLIASVACESQQFACKFVLLVRLVIALGAGPLLLHASQMQVVLGWLACTGKSLYHFEHGSVGCWSQ